MIVPKARNVTTAVRLGIFLVIALVSRTVFATSKYCAAVLRDLGPCPIRSLAPAILY